MSKPTIDVDVRLWRSRPESEQFLPIPDYVVRITTTAMATALDAAVAQAGFKPEYWQVVQVR